MLFVCFVICVFRSSLCVVRCLFFVAMFSLSVCLCLSFGVCCVVVVVRVFFVFVFFVCLFARCSLFVVCGLLLALLMFVGFVLCCLLFVISSTSLDVR